MSDVRLCRECGVPISFSKLHSWNDNGTITQVNKPQHPLLFYEVDLLRMLFENIEIMIDVSIGRMVTEGKRKSTYTYLHGLFPGLKKVLLKNFLPDAAYKQTVKLARVFGLGDFDYLGRKKGEYASLLCRNTYYVPFACGDLLAIFGYLEDVETTLDIEYAPNDAIKITARRISGSVEDMEYELDYEFPPLKPGNIKLRKCPGCTASEILKNFEWDIPDGIIRNRNNGMRMALIGPQEMHAIFRELEKELGSHMTDKIISAQCDCLKKTLTKENLRLEAGSVNRQVALRGFGNVVSFDIKEESLKAKVENAFVPELVTGYLVALLEISAGKTSKFEYRYNPDGTLNFQAEI